MIVETAVQLAEQNPVTMIAEDIDLLVLLLHRYRISDLHPIHFRSDLKSAGKTVKLWDIQ
ncbi:hypothetical protein DPMN_143609 [Dreissena polymorpha]|uniref:Uncharacterized protein n=1 Tax=Dreissena polymorpha TaxID=45954 RepID=A0A9D4JK68_DREPO|nr:hypothetical protein DPMN_143609 [Dreissena polymorpha]